MLTYKKAVLCISGILAVFLISCTVYANAKAGILQEIEVVLPSMTDQRELKLPKECIRTNEREEHYVIVALEQTSIWGKQYTALKEYVTITSEEESYVTIEKLSMGTLTQVAIGASLQLEEGEEIAIIF